MQGTVSNSCELVIVSLNQKLPLPIIPGGRGHLHSCVVIRKQGPTVPTLNTDTLMWNYDPLSQIFIDQLQIHTLGGYLSLVLVGRAATEFESRPIQIPIFQEKVTHSYTNWPKFWAKSPDFSNIFLNLSQFWFKFGKILKNQPIHIPDFAFYKGSFIYQEADFAYPCWRHIPVGSFVLRTPPVHTLSHTSGTHHH